MRKLEEVYRDEQGMEEGYFRLYAWNKDKRQKILLCETDARLIVEHEKGHWKETVYDFNSGKDVIVRSKSCGIPHCMCDLAIK